MTTPLPLAGKVALITGSSQGIGAATATHLSTLGAKVVINYHTNSSAATALVTQLGGPTKALAIQANAASLTDLDRLVAETLAWGGGKIDILIPNAGVGAQTCGLEKTTEEDFDMVVGTNVKGPLFLVQKAASHMPPHSHVLLLSSSLCNLTNITPNYLLYVSTKGAIEQMTRVLAKDLGRKGVLVNCIAPGPTATAMFLEGRSDELVKTVAGWNPFNRLGTPEDIARAVGWLVGGENTWVNGQVIRANGGMTV